VTQEPETDDEKARDGAGAERDVEGRLHAFAGRGRGAHVGAHRDVHADITGRTGQNCADHEPDGDMDAEEKAEDDRHHHAGDGDRPILTVEVGAGALLDGRRDLLHARGAGPGRHHLVVGIDAVDEGEHAARHDDPIGFGHRSKSFSVFLVRSGSARPLTLRF